MITFSLQSGSNGNAIYVEADGVRLLFDAGISGRQAKLRMGEHGRDMRNVDALILSHSHGDHTRCAGIYNRLFQIPIHATPATHRAISRYIGKVDEVRHFQPGETLSFGDVRVYTVPTPHDADESVGFIVEHECRRLGILTDLGHPFADLRGVIPELDAVYLESNYDPQMLAMGSYPEDLKARIEGAHGHLSNEEAADLLTRCDHRRLKWAALAHLSADNNDPNIAMEVHRARLGEDYPLKLASRYGVSELLTV